MQQKNKKIQIKSSENRKNVLHLKIACAILSSETRTKQYQKGGV